MISIAWSCVSNVVQVGVGHSKKDAGDGGPFTPYCKILTELISIMVVQTSIKPLFLCGPCTRKQLLQELP